MGLFGRKYDGSAIRNAEPTKPETLAFMNGPDLLGNPTSGQVYEDPRGPMNYNPGPTFKQRLGGFLEGTVNDLMHMRGIQNTALDQRRALEMYKRQQQDEIAQYERKQQIEAQYKTINPTEFERLLDASGFDPAKRTKVLQDYVTNRANPMIPMQGMDESGNRTVTFVPRNGAPSTPDVPQQAIDALLRGEGTDAQFDEAFGAGAAARVRGAGPGQPNFR